MATVLRRPLRNREGQRCWAILRPGDELRWQPKLVRGRPKPGGQGFPRRRELAPGRPTLRYYATLSGCRRDEVRLRQEPRVGGCCTRVRIGEGSGRTFCQLGICPTCLGDPRLDQL